MTTREKAIAQHERQRYEAKKRGDRTGEVLSQAVIDALRDGAELERHHSKLFPQEVVYYE